MDTKIIMEEAKNIQSELVAVRRKIHQHPEVAFDLPETTAFVESKLTEYGYTPKRMGKSGIIALAGDPSRGKTILLRADMDALPIEEEADVEYKSLVKGKMHGCGHDMHTAMLLGAANLIKEHEDELQGCIKLEFQPAEEIFQGSPDMLASGLLEDPHVDAAVMIHVTAGMPMPAGKFLISGGGVTSTSCEQYHITVKGKGGHGSVPHESIDPITAAAHVHIALAEINSREIDGNSFGVFTTGCFKAGSASNIIPDTAEMWGTIRTTDPDNKVGELIKKRIREISEGVAKAYRCEANVEFYDYCPCMYVDPALAKDVLKYVGELPDERAIDLSVVSGGKAGGGSEDFAFVSHHVPTVSMFLTAGNSLEGYTYSQHNPKVRFDDSVLYVGTAAFVHLALRYLEEHK